MSHDSVSACIGTSHHQGGHRFWSPLEKDKGAINRSGNFFLKGGNNPDKRAVTRPALYGVEQLNTVHFRPCDRIFLLIVCSLCYETATRAHPAPQYHVMSLMSFLFSKLCVFSVSTHYGRASGKYWICRHYTWYSIGRGWDLITWLDKVASVCQSYNINGSKESKCHPISHHRLRKTYQ